MYIEKGISDIEERRILRILFNHFDNLVNLSIILRNNIGLKEEN